MCLRFAISMKNLLDVLNANDKFSAHASAKVDPIINVLQIRDQAELINDEPNVPVAFLTAQSFLDSHIQHQLVNGGQQTADPHVIFHEHQPPLFARIACRMEMLPSFPEIPDENLTQMLL